MTADLPVLRETDPKIIIKRYLSNESTEDIAKTYGVTRQALGQYLLAEAEPEWKAAQVARAVSRKEEAEDDVRDARLELKGETDRETRERSLARVKVAETQLKSAQWDLERVCRRIYGQDQPANVGNIIQVVLDIRGAEATKHRSIAE